MYPIHFGNVLCGSAEIVQQGLYYKICCKSKILTGVPCKIYIQTDNDFINLGTCTKYGGSYYVETKIPCKKIPNEKMHFWLIPIARPNIFIPITNKAPFPYLKNLENAKVVFRGDQIGIAFIR